jgi:hypothetical protein
MDWPLSTVGEAGNTVAVNGGLTATTTPAQKNAALLSVTLTE